MGKRTPFLDKTVIDFSSGRNKALDIINLTLLIDTITDVIKSWLGEGSHLVVKIICMRLKM